MPPTQSSPDASSDLLDIGGWAFDGAIYIIATAGATALLIMVGVVFLRAGRQRQRRSRDRARMIDITEGRQD